MAATPDRTTIKAVIDELVDKLRTNLVADPPTATKPFRAIHVGPVGATDFPRPSLAVWLVRTKLVGVVDNDKIIEVATALRIACDVTEDEPHDTMFDAVGAVDDYFDSIIDTGVIEGGEGLDDRSWRFDYPTTTTGARLATASAQQTFIVKVEREQNRLPAS